jgi:hypothetical protein
MVYNFEEQYEKGVPFEKHFFKLLDERGQHPRYNNFGGENKAFDIEANGKKYEVKSDHKPNSRLAVELFHFKPSELKLDLGWHYVTEADFIIFYKTDMQQIFYLSRKQLQTIVENKLKAKGLAPTENKDMITYNMLFELDDLTDCIKKVEPYFLQ